MRTTLIILLTLFAPFYISAQIGGYDPDAIRKAEDTMDAFKAKDPKFDNFFNSAYGYVVFHSVAKGGIAIGGAHGNGIVYEQGKAIGKAKLTQVTLGLQFGGQEYSQLIFFESRADLLRFKQNNIEFAAQASAVAVKEGAGVNIAYDDGVAVFTMTKGGLMYEASLGGQKLKFKPFRGR